MKKETLHVKWMHCISCEMLIQNECEELWCKVNIVSHKKWIVDVEVPDSKTLVKVKNFLKSSWYDIVQEGEVWENSRPENIKVRNTTAIIWSFLFVWFIVFVLYMGQIDTLLPVFSSNAGLSIALLMWLIASVSTCLAVTWSIVLWFASFWDTTKTTKDHFKVQTSFHIWRRTGFFILWWLLGLIWQTLQLSLTATAIFNIVVAFVLLYMGLYMLDLVPSITKYWFHLPKTLTKKLHTQNNPLFAPIIWALTFFLPCGFTQSMQLVAMQSWGFMSGGLTMLLFAIWTTPVLFAVGMWWSYIKDHKLKWFTYLVWALIVYFSLFTLSNARSLLWWIWWNFIKNNTDAMTVSDTSWMSFEEVNVWHNWISIVPQVIQLESWKNYKLTILPESNGQWCMSTLVIPLIDRTPHNIIKWQAITFELINLKAGNYPIVCSAMGMSQWTIIVK